MESTQRTINTTIADVWMDSENITWIRFNKWGTHSINEAKQVVEAHNTLANGVKTPVLADLRNISTGADRLARKYYASEESSRCELCMAMVVTSPVQRMFGNLFMKLTNPPYPTRLFREEAEALAWIREAQSE